MIRKYPFTIQTFMRALKPVKTCGFMDMCANYYNECKEHYDNGESTYEIRGMNTKSGNPIVIFIQ